MATKVLVTGGSGLLGRAVVAALRESEELEVLGTAFSRAGDGLVRLDLTDAEAVVAFLREWRPEVILHCAAERRPDVCEGDAAATASLNQTAVTTLAREARELGAFVVMISTDYVFDGSAPPYAPDAEPRPLNKYGESKLAGERALLAELPGAVVLRVPVLFGPTARLDESAVTALVAAVRAQDTPKAVDAWAVRSPTFTPDIGRVLRSMVLLHRATPGCLSGVLHWTASATMTKHDMCVVMGELLGLPVDHLSPDPNPPAGAPRPRDVTMDASALSALIGGGHETGFREALASVLQ